MSYQDKMQAKQEAIAFRRFYPTMIAILEAVERGEFTIEEAKQQLRDMEADQFGSNITTQRGEPAITLDTTGWTKN